VVQHHFQSSAIPNPVDLMRKAVVPEGAYGSGLIPSTIHPRVKVLAPSQVSGQAGRCWSIFNSALLEFRAFVDVHRLEVPPNVAERPFARRARPGKTSPLGLARGKGRDRLAAWSPSAACRENLFGGGLTAGASRRPCEAPLHLKVQAISSKNPPQGYAKSGACQGLEYP